jgi:Flp pilus assembly pilin Flp
MQIAARGLTGPGLLQDEHGSVMAEYAVLLTVVALGLSLATASLGVPLTRMYLSQRTWLMLPYP